MFNTGQGTAIFESPRDGVLFPPAVRVSLSSVHAAQQLHLPPPPGLSVPLFIFHHNDSGCHRATIAAATPPPLLGNRPPPTVLRLMSIVHRYPPSDINPLPTALHPQSLALRPPFSTQPPLSVINPPALRPPIALRPRLSALNVGVFRLALLLSLPTLATI